MRQRELDAASQHLGPGVAVHHVGHARRHRELRAHHEPHGSGHLGCAAVTRLRIAGEGALGHGGQRRGPGGVGVHDGLRQRRRGARQPSLARDALEEARLGQDFPEKHAHRIQIGACAPLARPELLGREVLHRASVGERGEHAPTVRAEETRHAVEAEQHRLRPHVPVDHGGLLHPVQRAQRREDVDHAANAHIHGEQLPGGLGQIAETVDELPLHELGGDQQVGPQPRDVANGRQVRVAEGDQALRVLRERLARRRREGLVAFDDDQLDALGRVPVGEPGRHVPPLELAHQDVALVAPALAAQFHTSFHAGQSTRSPGPGPIASCIGVRGGPKGAWRRSLCSEAALATLRP